MTSVKISALPALTAANALDADVLPIVSSYTGTPTTYKITLAQLRIQLNEGAQTFSGLVTAQAGLAVTGTGTFSGLVTAPTVMITGAAGTLREISYRTAGVLRWDVYTDLTGEGGANAGSNFNITRYSDAGAPLGTALIITRSSGNAAFEADLALAGKLVLGSATATGVGAGEVVLANAKSLRGANAANNATTGLIQREASGLVKVDPDGVGCAMGSNLLVAGAVATGGFLSVAAGGATIVGGLTLTGFGSGSGVVSVGAADSGGAGFKLLRVPN